MEFSVVSRYFPLFVLLFAIFFTSLHCEILGTNPHFCFSFERFEKNRSLDAAIALYGDAEIKDSAVKITRPVGSSSWGRVMYRKAVRFMGRNPGFSTNLSFSVSSSGSGEGLAFFLVPSSAALEESTKGLQFGLPPSAIVVKFAILSDPKSGNLGGNHVGIEIGSEASKLSSNLSNVSLVPAGEKLHSWIDYDGNSKRLEVRLSNLNASRPQNPLISYPLALSGALQEEEKLAGIRASSRNSTQATSLYSWSFAVKRGAPYLMHSEPLDPQAYFVQARESPPIHPRRSDPWGIFLAMVFAVACGGLVTFFVMWVWFALVARRPVAPVEYPVQPVEVGYQKIELVVGDKGAEIAKK